MLTNRLFPAVLALAVALSGAAQPANPESLKMRWDFEDAETAGLLQGAGSGEVVPEPGQRANRVYQISTDQPHHARLTIQGSERHPNFILRFRARIADWEGAEPIVYAYGRSGKEGFRGLSLARKQGRLFCYFGQDKPAPTLGKTPGGYGIGETWLRVAFCCFGRWSLAKVWAADDVEPGWQALGRDEELRSGVAAVGVWTSPRTPSKATVFFDDIMLKPIKNTDLHDLGIHITPRLPLDVTALDKAKVITHLPKRVVLSADRTAVAFDRTSGEITNVVDVHTQREFIAPHCPFPLFRFVLQSREDGKRRMVTSRDFRQVNIDTTTDKGLRLSFSDLPGSPTKATVEAIVQADKAIALRFRLTGVQDVIVPEISFPELPGPAAVSPSDELLLPWASGAVLPEPGSIAVSRGALYPGSAFTQFYARCDGKAGLYVGFHDAEGHCKRYQLRCVAGDSASISVAHLRPEVAVPEVTLPYPSVLQTFAGDWRDGADIYKQWAKQQSWCATPLAERQDIPQFLKDGAGILITGIANPNGREKLMGAHLEKLPDLLDAYREATGLKHIVFVPYGWENRGTWVGINYLPSIPSNEDWIRTNSILRERGHRTAFLTSGFWWVVKRQKTGGGPAFDDTEQFERLKNMCITQRDGTTWEVDWYDRTKVFGSWRGLSVKLCHGSKPARDTLRDVFLGVAQLGVPLISFDQEIGGGQKEPCFHSDHGHPPGLGNWGWTDFHALCREIISKGKPVKPELGLFMENVSELAIPVMSTYWSRQFGEIDVGASSARGVGLFSYLYHEYVTAIGAACVQGQGQLGTRPDALLRCRILANNLTRGLIPGPFMHDVPIKGLAVWQKVGKWQATISQAYRSFCRPYKHFPEYLILGRTMRPPTIECDQVETFFWRRDPKGKPCKHGPPVSKRSLTLAAVTAGTFQAQDGTRATFVVNPTPAERQATVRLSAPAEVTIFTPDRQELSRHSAQEIRLTLPPFGIRVFLQ